MTASIGISIGMISDLRESCYEDCVGDHAVHKRNAILILLVPIWGWVALFVAIPIGIFWVGRLLFSVLRRK